VKNEKRKRPPFNGVLYLVIAIPCTAVVLGALMLYIAFSQPDPGVQPDGVPLSKTSWQHDS
jgi:hypothetical protein